MAGPKICAQTFPVHSSSRSLAAAFLLILLACVIAVGPTAPAWAVSKDSAEVWELIDRGLDYLEENTGSEARLGGKCLIALALYKGKRPKDHPAILEAIEACKKSAAKDPRVAANCYSNGLAIILLSELDGKKYRGMIDTYAGAMAQRQKKFGGWTYDHYKTGDTSQTQYAVLSNWEMMMQVGATPNVQMIDDCVNWLMRTQDPSGVWGYQGKDPGTFGLVEQEETSSSMLLAGLGSIMMAGNMLGMLTTVNQQQELQEDSPGALKEVQDPDAKKMPILRGSKVDRQRLMKSIQLGQKWFDKNFKYAEGKYPYYELYSLERYKSFEELMTGDAPEEPDWYQEGYKIIKSKMKEDGSLRDASGRVCGTAFGMLFLLRSTQASIQARLGEGTLIGGRGLSADLSKMKMRNGRLITEAKPTEVDKLLGMLDGEGSEELDALLKSPASLIMANIGPEQTRRLQQIVQSGGPDARVMAVRALGRMRKLDLVPTLLFAMTDPDSRVVREARDGLRLVSRRFQGFGLKDNFEDAERYEAIDKWKQWYRRVRPNAPPLP